MTREDAIAYGKRVIDLGLNDETQAFCELAIKALEQEPCCNCIEFKRYAKEMGFEIEQEPCESVLDDIKAEIKRKTNSGQWSDAVIFGMQKAIAIIDKYKAGSEEKG